MSSVVVLDESLVEALTASHGPFLALVSQRCAGGNDPIITVFQWDHTNPTVSDFLLRQLEAEKADYPYVPEQGWSPLVPFPDYKPGPDSPTAHAAFVAFTGTELSGVVAVLPHDPVKAIDPDIPESVAGQYGPFISGLPDTDEHNPAAAVVDLAKAARAFIFTELSAYADLLTGPPAEGLDKLLGAAFAIEEKFTYNGRPVVIATFLIGCDDEDEQTTEA
jgi:hypothetical protein